MKRFGANRIASNCPECSGSGSDVFRARFLAQFTLSSFAALRTVRSGRANGLGMTPIGNVFQDPARLTAPLRPGVDAVNLPLRETPRLGRSVISSNRFGFGRRSWVREPTQLPGWG